MPNAGEIDFQMIPVPIALLEIESCALPIQNFYTPMQHFGERLDINPRIIFLWEVKHSDCKIVYPEGIWFWKIRSQHFTACCCAQLLGIGNKGIPICITSV